MEPIDTIDLIPNESKLFKIGKEAYTVKIAYSEKEFNIILTRTDGYQFTLDLVTWITQFKSRYAIPEKETETNLDYDGHAIVRR